MKQIDIVIPTMWRCATLIDALKTYTTTDVVRKIIVIDNDVKKRPKDDVLKHPKIELVNYGKNIYVNPAWNEGYYRVKTDVFAIINDDIEVEADVFRDIVHTDFTEIDIVGVHLKSTPDNYHIGKHDDEDKLFKLNVNKKQAIGGQSYAFGVCMFIKKSFYPVIPSLYQIWFGDDYLVQRATNIYCLKTSRITGEISKTLVSVQKDTQISDRIVLDCINVSTYGHLKHSKDWDLVRQTVDRSKMRFVTSQKKEVDIFESEYQKAKSVKSDINENLPILYELAKECKHVTEMGVRTGVSTRAFLNTDVELISYDIVLDSNVSKLFEIAKARGKKVAYVQADTLKLEILETDLLFIDTLHTYSQLKKELSLHGNKAKKYLAFHDTITFGLKGEDGVDKKGLLSAVIEFVVENPHWKFKVFKTNNNGMTVLERRQ